MSIIRELLDLTPLPPETADVDVVLAAFEEMFAARQQVLERAAQTDEKPDDTEENRALAMELAARDAAWQAALHATRDRVGAARQGTSRMRSYAR